MKANVHLKAHAAWNGRPVSPIRLGKFIAALAIVLYSLLVQGQGKSQVPATNPEMQFQQALAAQERGDNSLAIAIYSALLEQTPDATAVRVNLAVVLAREKRFQEAIKLYLAVLANDPGSRPVRMNLASAYQDNGELSLAVAELERLHREDALDEQASLALADAYLHLNGREEEAVALLSPLERAHPDDPDVKLPLGKALIRTGHPAEGVMRVEAVALATSNAEACLLAGQTRFKMNQFDLARNDAEAAKRLRPRIAGLASLRGMILEQTADYEGAEAALQEALAANPNDFQAQFYLGANEYFRRDMGKATQHLVKALELEPSSAQARYELALVERADGQPDEALKNLEAVTRQIPGWLEPHVELSALYFRMHRPEDGLRERQLIDQMMSTLQQVQTQHAQ